MAIQPVKRKRAYEDIVSQLADMVRRGELRPGERLPSERDLAVAFGVGRPTLRQALSVLAQAGVVEVMPGSGVYLRKQVPEPTGEARNAMAMLLMTEQQNLHDILELRIAIESEAAALAAVRRTSAQVAKLQSAFDALVQAYQTRGTAVEEDYQFHFVIAETTGNPVLLKVMTSLADLFTSQLAATTRSLYNEPERIPLLIREHDAILQAIVAQQPDGARAAVTKHLGRVGDWLRRVEAPAGV